MNEEKELLLEKAGLTKNESKVYVALLGLGLTTSKAIIEKTSIHRQLVYDALDSLTEKGLVSYVIQGNKKHFKASNPERFLEHFSKKTDEIESQKKEFLKILPELKKKNKETKEKQEATLYTGHKGIKSLMDDMLAEEKEMLIIGSSDIDAEAYKYHSRFNIPVFHKAREKKQTPLKILLSSEMKERARKLNKLKHTEARVLPKEFTSNTGTQIYGDKISIIVWGSQPFGILIESKEIATTQKKHFDLLWKLAKAT